MRTWPHGQRQALKQVFQCKDSYHVILLVALQAQPSELRARPLGPVRWATEASPAWQARPHPELLLPMQGLIPMSSERNLRCSSAQSTRLARRVQQPKPEFLRLGSPPPEPPSGCVRWHAGARRPSGCDPVSREVSAQRPSLRESMAAPTRRSWLNCGTCGPGSDSQSVYSGLLGTSQMMGLNP
jgi:hypothetical protein